MDRVKVDNLSESPYGGGARYLYNDLREEGPRETMDLLQMVPEHERQQMLNNTHTAPAEVADCGHSTAHAPSGGFPAHSGGSTTGNDTYGEKNKKCPQYSNPQQQQDQLAQDDYHLCQKHARQLENKTNTLYDRHQPGCLLAEEDPYYTRVPAHSNNYKTTDKTDAGTVYFNYLRQFKKKGNNQSRSTQSLPAVTYTVGKNHKNKSLKKKHSLKSPPKLFRNGGHPAAAITTYNRCSSGSIYKDKDYGDGNHGSGYKGIKKLLIFVCALIGIVLALGGILVGFVILPNKTKAPECDDGSLYCQELGCIPISSLCSDPDYACPGYTAMAVCDLPNTQENTTQAADNIDVETPQPVLTQSVTSKLVYDVDSWVHFKHGDRESKYRVINSTVTFIPAQQLCQGHGGHLAHVTDIREQVFIEDYLKDLFSVLPVLARSPGVWLGARRQTGSNSRNCMVHQQWRWQDAYSSEYGAIDGFTAFGPGRPDDFYNPEECLYVNTKVDNTQKEDQSFLKWDDAPCDTEGLGLRPLCEVEL